MKNLSFCRKGIVFLGIIGAMLMQSCAILKAPEVTRHESMKNYKYVYINQTHEKSSVHGGIYGNGYGYTASKTISPGEIISSHFIKRGYVIVNNIKDENLDKTMIVNYSESGRRQISLFSYTIEITIQITSAKSDEVICVGVAEGQGETESDDIRVAINRCMEAIFQK